MDHLLIRLSFTKTGRVRKVQVRQPHDAKWHTVPLGYDYGSERGWNVSKGKLHRHFITQENVEMDCQCKHKSS